MQIVTCSRESKDIQIIVFYSSLKRFPVLTTDNVVVVLKSCCTACKYASHIENNV